MVSVAIPRDENSGENRVVLCMKWGKTYSADYVNVLYNAVMKNVTTPVRFVCLTNEPAGLVSGIETFPIPDLGIADKFWYHGAWPKISVFQRDLYGLSGRCLFIDLDSFVLGNLDGLFETKDAFIGIDTGENWRKSGSGTHPPLLGTGVFAFDLGELGFIVDDFMNAQKSIIATHDLEQVYVHHRLGDIGFWPSDWVISFKRHVRQPIGLDRIFAPKPPPSSAKILAFHGHPRPIELIKGNNWARFPHYGKGVVEWARQYWLTHGGVI